MRDSRTPSGGADCDNKGGGGTRFKTSQVSTIIAEPQSKYQRFELFLWRECFTLAYNNLGPAPWANQYLQAGFRILTCLALLSLSFYHLINNKEPTLYFFTNWGIFLTTISFTLFTALYLRTWLTPESH
jgi:hypothetical protein